MSVTKEVKKEVIGQYKHHDSDTGSYEVQIALLTKRIDNLAGHFKLHVKDHSSRRGLIMLVNKRRSLLKSLKAKDLPSYQKIVDQLDLRG
jgi:small subunit ribosomal protein S15